MQDLTNDVDVDLAVLGSGFAGSLIAMIARRQDLSVAMIDRAAHPRFAIGESSTPIANLVLRDLASRYDLMRLVPLCKFGEWQRHYPQLRSGLKRGFTYFQHQPDQPFSTDFNHSQELAVAASHDAEHSDTHWYRADVDAFLVEEAERLGVLNFDQTHLDLIERGPPWVFGGLRAGARVRIQAKFVMDGTGESGLLPRFLGLHPQVDQVFTKSRAIFSHFKNLLPFEAVLRDRNVRVDNYPFGCDDAAQHQILDRAWIWMLRFQDDLASVGLVIDMEREEDSSPQLAAEDEWNSWLCRFPTIAQMLNKAVLAPVPGRLIATRRLQRKWSEFSGPDWALLPHSAGFVDALHSSGLAQSLCGVERLAHIFEAHWGRPTLSQALENYSRAVDAELRVIDRLVHGCFLTFGRFPMTVAYSMMYFAAATTYEQRRLADGFRRDHWFLEADDEGWTNTLFATHDALLNWRDNGKPDWPDFADFIARKIDRYNHVGLCCRESHNMYRYTAPVEPSSD